MFFESFYFLIIGYIFIRLYYNIYKSIFIIEVKYHYIKRWSYLIYKKSINIYGNLYSLFFFKLVNILYSLFFFKCYIWYPQYSRNLFYITK